MPQPLSEKDRLAGIKIGVAGFRALTLRPQLAIRVAEAVASFANVESFLLRLFVRLLGGDASLATRIFLKLEIQAAKSVALVEAINSIETPRYAELARALVAISKSNQKTRDKLVHHIWGIADMLPDVVLLMDPKSTISVPIDLSGIYVYKAKDFEDIIAANDKLCQWGLRLEFILMDHPANQGDALYEKLCKEPAILERLNRPAKPDRSAP